MPKITVAGGPSSALGQEAEPPAVPEDAAPAEPAAPAPAPAPKAAPSLAAPKQAPDAVTGSGGVVLPKPGAGNGG